LIANLPHVTSLKRIGKDMKMLAFTAIMAFLSALPAVAQTMKATGPGRLYCTITSSSNLTSEARTPATNYGLLETPVDSQNKDTLSEVIIINPSYDSKFILRNVDWRNLDLYSLGNRSGKFGADLEKIAHKFNMPTEEFVKTFNGAIITEIKFLVGSTLFLTQRQLTIDPSGRVIINLLATSGADLTSADAPAWLMASPNGGGHHIDLRCAKSKANIAY
jgi:hypothetical protein